MFARRAAAVPLCVAKTGFVPFELDYEAWERASCRDVSPLPAEAEIPRKREGHARRAVSRLILARGNRAMLGIKAGSNAQ